MNNFSLMTFHESSSGRIFRKGVPLTFQEIGTIHKLEEKGLSAQDIKNKTGLDIRTVKKYMGGNSHYGVGGNRKFNEEVKKFIKEIVKKEPHIYLKEIKDKMQNDLQVSRSVSQIWTVLSKQFGLKQKKVVKICYYRTTERVQNLRAQFRSVIQNYHPYSLFYIDESHFESDDQERTIGWGEPGEKVQTTTHKYSRKTYSLIMAIGCFGIVYYELIETTKEKINYEKFQNFMENLIILTPDGVTFYMDNASIHHKSEIIGLMEIMNMEWVFSSPYSPDYNPIEVAFGWIKRKMKEYKNMELEESILKAISEVTPELCRQWIYHTAKNWIKNDI